MNTLNEKIKQDLQEANRLAEYSCKSIHSPDYRTSVALSSIAMTLNVLVMGLMLELKEDKEK